MLGLDDMLDDAVRAHSRSLSAKITLSTRVRAVAPPVLSIYDLRPIVESFTSP